MKKYLIFGTLLLLFTFSGCDWIDGIFSSNVANDTDATYLIMVVDQVYETLPKNPSRNADNKTEETKKTINTSLESLFQLSDTSTFVLKDRIPDLRTSLEKLFESLKSSGYSEKPDTLKTNTTIIIDKATKYKIESDVLTLYSAYLNENQASKVSYLPMIILSVLILIGFIGVFYYYNKKLFEQSEDIDKLKGVMEKFKQQYQNLGAEFQKNKSENNARFDIIGVDIQNRVSDLDRKIASQSTQNSQGSFSSYRETDRHPPKPVDKVFYVKSATFSDSDPVKLSEDDFKSSSSGNFYKVTLKETEGILELNMDEKRNFGPIFENPKRFILPFCKCIIDNSKRYNGIESMSSGKLVKRGQYWEIKDKISVKLIEA